MDYRTVLAEWFAEDDGSLPELEIAGLSSSEASELRGRLWRYSSDAKPAHELHWVVSPNVEGHLLPEIGVGVFEHSVVLDWRMGPEWDSPTIAVFFALVHDLMATCEAPELVLERGITTEARGHFMNCWSEFVKERVGPNGQRAF